MLNSRSGCLRTGARFDVDGAGASANAAAEVLKSLAACIDDRATRMLGVKLISLNWWMYQRVKR